MALRVLLADESSTIKKVFQLALQDYAVEVQSVNVGLDVIDVAESFKPDIIFADVLLQKRNGYDVSADIKAHNQLKETPVVLMWSGFMDLDEDKFEASQANGQLEKPFDVQGLRKIIQGLVGKTKTQSLAEFLEFPEMPKFEEQPPQLAQAPSVDEMLNLPQAESPTGPIEKGNWDMDSFEQPPSIDLTDSDDSPELQYQAEEFQQVNLPPVKPTAPPIPESSGTELFADDDEDNNWVQKDISKYRVDANPELDSDDDEMPVNYVVSDEQIQESEIIDSNTMSAKTTTFTDREFQVTDPEELPDLPVEGSDDLEVEDVHEIIDPQEEMAQLRLTEEKLEAIIKEHSTEMLEKVIWKVVPDLATQIIERELDRLLKDRGL